MIRSVFHGLYPDPRERPILSLSCHGDRDDIGEQPEMKRNYVREMNRIANDMKKKHKKNLMVLNQKVEKKP